MKKGIKCCPKKKTTKYSIGLSPKIEHTVVKDCKERKQC